MAFKAMVTFIPQFNKYRETYYVTDSKFFLPKHFNRVRKVVAEYYLKKFASAKENLHTVYDYMDKNGITYKYFKEHLPGRYHGMNVDNFTFTRLFSVYEHAYNLEWMYTHPEYYDYEYGQYRREYVNSLVSFVNDFERNYDFTTFIREKFLDKEYETILFLRTQVNEHEEQSGYIGMLYETIDDYIPPSTKEDHHSAKMAKKMRCKSPKRREQNRRGGRYKRPLVEQCS